MPLHLISPRRGHLTPGLLLLAALALVACAPKGPVRPGAPPEPVYSEQTARAAEAAGEYVLAAREYALLARQSEAPSQQHFQLRSVETLIRARQLQEARTQLQRISIAGLDASFDTRKRLLEAHLAILEEGHDAALKLLAQAEKGRNLNPAHSAELHRLRALALIGSGRPLDAVRSLMTRERYIVDGEDLARNQRQLWSALEKVPSGDFDRARATQTDAAFLGWLDLAVVVRSYPDHLNQRALAIDEWRKRNPTHPANAALLQSLASGAPDMVGPLRTIALLLPLSSDYAQAAQAVRDGFLAMHNANPDPNKPTVVVQDIGNDVARAASFYDAAVAQGAQFVVGPLGLEATDRVVKESKLNVPTLLLSHTTQALSSSVRFIYQFGLPPEQEAAQAAERAWLDGHRRAVVLYAQTAQGERLRVAFEAAWARLGGLVVATQGYGGNATEFSQPIKDLFHISQSDARKDQIEQLLGAKLKFEARPRDDVDMLFLAGDARRARLIKPLLNYHRVGKVPVYATSHVFTGRGDAVTDVDMNGIFFGDMPWMLAGSGRVAELRASLPQATPYQRSPLARLYALGVDAYAVIPELNRLGVSGEHYAGVTSGLTLEGDGRLRRQLLWAQFRKGLPVLVDGFQKNKGLFDAEETPDTQNRRPGN